MRLKQRDTASEDITSVSSSPTGYLLIDEALYDLSGGLSAAAQNSKVGSSHRLSSRPRKACTSWPS